MFKVFVSYSTTDLRNVTELRQSIAGSGVEVFVAEHAVRPGQQLSDTISSAIAGCDLFVLLWSDNAKASEWVSQEIGKAHSLKKEILPLILTDGLRLPGFIDGLKYLSLAKEPTLAMEKARKVILSAMQRKIAAEEKKKQSDTLALFAIGAICLWAASQK